LSEPVFDADHLAIDRNGAFCACSQRLDECESIEKMLARHDRRSRESHRLPWAPDWVVPPVIILLEANLPIETWVKTGAL
jgi:hypothetical protein